MLRPLILPVYLPCFFINGGTAMLVPLLPLYLADVGVSESMLGLIIASAGVGGMVSQIPWGRLIDRIGDNAVLILSVAVIVCSVSAFGVIGSAIALGALRFFGGAGSAGWVLSRQTFLTHATSPTTRGKAMALFGGTTRSAFLVGPVALGAVPLLVLKRRVDTRPTSDGTDDQHSTASAPRPSLRPHLRNLGLAGSGQVLVIAARTGRFVVLPLVGESVGLSVSQVGLLIGLGSLADLVLFPVSGVLMDRFGRLYAIVPAFTLMGAGLFILAAASTGLAVTIAAVVIGVGNGLGSGTMLTLSADLAPVEGPSRFLAALGTIRDLGKVAGPLAVGVITDAASLSVSSAVMGVTSLAAVAVIAFGIGETLDRSTPETVVG